MANQRIRTVLLAWMIVGGVAGSARVGAEPRGTFELHGGFQLGPSHVNDGPDGLALAPMFAVETSLHVVHGVSVVAAWGGAAASDEGLSGGLANPYVGVRARLGSAWAIEVEVGATLPMRDLDEGSRCRFDDPPGSHVYSGCRGKRDAFGRTTTSDSGLYRAALGRGYRDPWLWAVDWNNTVVRVRAMRDTELGPLELGTFGVVAFERTSDARVGVVGVTGELRPRWYGVGLTAAHAFGDESMTQLAASARLLRRNGPTTFEVRVDVPVPGPNYTALSLGMARTF